MEQLIEKEKNISIMARKIEIGKDVIFGKDIDINIQGILHIGSRCHMGSDIQMRGNNIHIGDDLYHSSGLRIGGGGIHHPNANCTIGDRCTIHNNLLNIGEPITIGNDVGLSPEVSIITHGYWLSVLEGFPAKFAAVSIGNGAIIGYRSLILMGVTIGTNVVVGAGSIVIKNLESNSVYAGNPIKLIKKIIPLNRNEKIGKLDEIISRYREIAEYHKLNPSIQVNFPIVKVNKMTFNVETLECSGIEDDETDDFRDYVRKWGLRYYTNRPFRSVFRE